MNDTAEDIRAAIAPKTDQLNADDLLTGPIVERIVRVTTKKAKEQTVSVHLEGRLPWKPSKGMLRILVEAWGLDSSKWIGQHVKLFREPTVEYGSSEIGGIQIAAMTNIKGRTRFILTKKRGVKVPFFVDELKAPSATPAPDVMALDVFVKWCGWATANGWTKAQVTELLGCKTADVPPEKRAELVERMKTPPVAAPPMTLDEAARDAARENDPDAHNPGD
jgi:hypothetical protein